VTVAEPAAMPTGDSAVVEPSPTTGVPSATPTATPAASLRLMATATATATSTPTPEPTVETTAEPAEEATPEATPANTPTPKLSAARLAGSWDVTITVLKRPSGGDLKKGDQWTDTWTITPNCSSGACAAAVDAGIGPSGYTYRSFSVDLTRSGAQYSGSTRSKITTCGGDPPLGVWVKNKVALQIEVTSAATYNGAWVATQWTGTMVLHAPYTETGMLTYCPAQNWKMSLTATQ